MILWKKSRKQLMAQQRFSDDNGDDAHINGIISNTSLSCSHHNDVIDCESVYFFHITAFSSHWVT